MAKPLRVLTIEDSEDDALLLIRELRRGGFDPTFERVETPETMATALDKQTWDIVIADYVMPHFSGLDALNLLKKRGLDIPFIIVSGSIGEDIAVAAMKAGARDYLMKNNLTRLVPAIEQQLREAEVRRRLKKSEKAFQETQRSLEAVVETAPSLIVLTDADGRIILFNRACEELTGYKREEVLGKTIPELFLPPEWVPVVQKRFANPYSPELRAPHENPWLTKSGEERLIEWCCTALPSPKDGRPCILGTGIDITERKQGEDALRKSEERAKLVAQENAIVAEIGRITSSTLNIEEVYERFAGEMHKLIDFDRLAVNIIDPEERTFAVPYVSGSQVPDRRTEDVIPLAGTGTEEIMRTRSSLFILDKDWESAISRCPGLSPIFKAGFQSVMMVPLISKNDVIGVLNIQSTRLNAYTETDLRIAERIGIQISGAIANAHLFAEHRRTETILQEQLGFLQVLIDTIPSPIFYKDRDGKFLGCNKAWEQMNGLKREQMMGKTVYDVAPPELAAIYRARDEELLSRGGVQTYDASVTSVEGKKHDVIFNKASFTKADGSVGGLVGVITDITERKRAEETLQVTQFSLEHAPESVFWINSKGQLDYANEAACHALGYTREELVAMSLWDIDTEFPPETWATHWQNLPKRGPITRESHHRTKDGKIFPVEITGDYLKYGAKEYNVAFVRDITERKKAEKEMAELQEQLRQSQKMEAIGRLAGGIAHDFNNLLTVIKGYTQLSLTELKVPAPLKVNIEEINKAADRAAELTYQLLAFSRRQILELRVLDLNILLQNLDKMLRRVIGEDVELVTLMPDDLGRVKTDRGQIEQVILNLAVNARDAMQQGGKLTIETANVELDEEYARSHVAVTPGRYVMLSVSDTGVGMTPEVKERVFEPFFTTKKEGKGTGLGLSTVYGIVKQSGGNIWVYSEPGKGTTFKIYLPRVDEPLKELREKAMGVEIPRGDETILIVEDDEVVLKLAVRILSDQGYKVLQAPQGLDAFLICAEHDGPIHLLLTDVVMPKMSGRELAETLISLRPGIKVLYMSGYTDNTITHHGILDEGTNYIQKPFSVAALARKVREVLDG